MKVLTVCHRMPFFGGAELVILKLCEYMAREGIKNITVVPKGMPPEMFGQMPATPIVEKAGSGGGRAGQYLRLQKAVRSLAESGKPDAVSVHNFPAMLACWGVKKPVVWMCNEPPEVFDTGFNIGRKLLLALNRYFVRHYVTEAIVADEFNAQRFKDIYGFQPHIIPYGVDYDFWAEGERNTKHEDFIILQVGTVTKLKNQMATVQAAARLKKAIPNLRVYLVGWNNVEPRYTKEIKDFAWYNWVDKVVEFTGPMSHTELRKMYKKADVVVHPVRQQGGWLTPFEAMATGVPVIVSSEATCSQMILQNDLGYVSQDNGSLADLVEAVYGGNIVGTDKMAHHAQQWVKDNLTWDKFCSAYVGVMEEAVEKYERRVN